MKRLLPFLFLLGALPGGLRAQVIYFNDISTNILSLNVQTCNVSILPGGPFVNDMAISSPSLAYGIFANLIIEVNLTNGANNVLGQIPGIVTGLELGQNGLLYALGTNLWSFNIATGTAVDLGALPNNWFCTGDMVYLNGIYYATVYDITNGGNHQMISVNLSNPALSTIVTTPPTTNLVAGAAIGNSTCPKLYWFDSPPGGLSVVYEYDVNTQTWSTICPNFSYIAGGADTPNNYTFPLSCACSSVAGNIASPDLVLCGNTPASVPATTGALLDNNDLLQYILYSNPQNIAGSVLASNATPNFAYNPFLYTNGTTYYIAAVVGNNNNGQVDLQDPCLSVSNAIQVVWRPLPGLTLQNAPQPLCAGACVDISLNLSGTAPFTLTYTTPFSGVQSQIFPASGTQQLTLCIPANQAPGGVQLQPLSIQDAFCICP
jgi:hypothetical protein